MDNMQHNIICVSVYYTEMHENDYHKMCKSGWEGIAQERRNQELVTFYFFTCVVDMHYFISISRS